jgi:thiamine-monophosphate kinase
MPDTVADLGEFGLIAAITGRLPQGGTVVLGPGDDAAVVAAPDGRVVATTDLLIEHRHFRRDWSSAYDVGRKAAAQNLSDVVALGARPTALLAGLGAPPDLPVDWVLGLADGLRDEGEPLGVSVVGGDTVRSESIVVAVTALGDLGGRDPVTRAGARAGDVVAVCGRLGWAEAGFRVLSRGFRSPRVLVDAHRRPVVPYDAGPEAVGLGVTAMCDVSDGLLADLRHIAEASGVAIDVRSDALDVPDPIRDIAGALGADPLLWILTGGDDNALAATFPSEAALPARWRVIGAVSAGAGVTVDGEAYEGPGGHTHFG